MISDDAYLSGHSRSAMTSRVPRSRVVAVIALLGVGVALVLLRLLGQTMPTVPPGLVFVLVAAVVMLAVPRRWTASLGLLASAAEVLGVLLGSGLSGLFAP